MRATFTHKFKMYLFVINFFNCHSSPLLAHDLIPVTYSYIHALLLLLLLSKASANSPDNGDDDDGQTSSTFPKNYELGGRDGIDGGEDDDAWDVEVVEAATNNNDDEAGDNVHATDRSQEQDVEDLSEENQPEEEPYEEAQHEEEAQHADSDGEAFQNGSAETGNAGQGDVVDVSDDDF